MSFDASAMAMWSSGTGRGCQSPKVGPSPHRLSPLPSLHLAIDGSAAIDTVLPLSSAPSTLSLHRACLISRVLGPDRARGLIWRSSPRERRGDPKELTLGLFLPDGSRNVRAHSDDARRVRRQDQGDPARGEEGGRPRKEGFQRASKRQRRGQFIPLPHLFGQPA